MSLFGATNSRRARTDGYAHHKTALLSESCDVSRSGRAAVLLAAALLAGIEAAATAVEAAESQKPAHRYVLVRERADSEKLCRALRPVLNDKETQPLCDGDDIATCRLDTIPSGRFPEFSLIPSQSLDPKTHGREIRAMSDYLATMGSPGRETPGETWTDWYWRTQVEPNVKDAIQRDALRLSRATFDINNDGAEETVLFFDDRSCDPPGCRMYWAVLDPETLQPDRQTWTSAARATPIRFRARTFWVDWDSAVPYDARAQARADAVAYFSLWELKGTSDRSFVGATQHCVYAIVRRTP